MAVQVIDGNQLDNYLTNEKTILVFFTYWCGPCKMLAPILEEISDKYNVLKIQGDIETKATTDFKIEAFPTMFLLNDKKIVKKYLGFLPKEQLIDWIDN